MKQLWIYDIEQYRNFHCATFQTRDGTDTRQFVIHELLNQSKDYLKFLQEEVDGLIGFNNLNYDSPIMNRLYDLLNGGLFVVDFINSNLYQLSCELISNSESNETKFHRKSRWKELDLFKIHHFDNKAKLTGLKAIGIALKHENIQDLPYDPTDFIDTEEKIYQIVHYNLNDVAITKKLFIITIPKIDMRIKFGEQYGLNVINSNDPQIGSKLIQKYLSKALNIDSYELSKQRTFRKEIKLNDIILPYIHFQTEPFNNILKYFQNTIVTKTKDAFSDLSLVKNEVKYVFGTGGIHGCKRSGVYIAEADESIILLDVNSFYPNIAIKNSFYPQHLTKKFCLVYDDIYQQRLKAKRSGDKIIDEGLKLSCNAVFGKSNDVYSFLYDPAFTMKITVNGQLLLAMLTERLILANVEILQVNTDGIMIRCKKSNEDNIKSICAEWESLTKLSLDYDYFTKIIMLNVNNYIAVYVGDSEVKKTKQKGVFLIERELHKDHSMKIVRKAILDYFVYNIPVEETIRNHTDIYDFCIRHKSIGAWKAEAHSLKDWEEKVDNLNKNVRFFVSISGSSLYKKNKKDNRQIGIRVGKTVTLFNQYFEKPMNEYNIDYAYYIKEAYDIIYSVDDGQLNLF